MQNQILTAIVSATIAFFAGAYLANAKIGIEYEYPSYSDFPRTYGIGYAEQDYSSTFGTWCDESCKLYVPDSGRYFTPDCPRIIDGYMGDLSKKGNGTYYDDKLINDGYFGSSRPFYDDSWYGSELKNDDAISSGGFDVGYDHGVGGSDLKYDDYGYADTVHQER